MGNLFSKFFRLREDDNLLNAFYGFCGQEDTREGEVQEGIVFKFYMLSFCAGFTFP